MATEPRADSAGATDSTNVPQSGHSRRSFLSRGLAVASGLVLAGCDRLSQSEWFPKALSKAESLNRVAQRAVTTRTSMAQEFAPADRSPTFRSNGTSSPQDPAYQAMAATNFEQYSLQIGGLVANPAAFTLAQLRALPSRTQITRHDCVEGWSAIAQWQGARLSALLAHVQPLPTAKYVVFYCADPMSGTGSKYYESIDMEDANHPQTLLAYEINDAPLPIENGAPLRLRVERQLGYKQAKYIMRIELVSSFAHIAGGQGGYWEDQGYEWYAGI